MRLFKPVVVGHWFIKRVRREKRKEKREKRSEEGKKGKAGWVRECLRGNAEESDIPAILAES